MIRIYELPNKYLVFILRKLRQPVPEANYLPPSSDEMKNVWCSRTETTFINHESEYVLRHSSSILFEPARNAEENKDLVQSTLLCTVSYLLFSFVA
jgi:hypothetical protein